MDLKDGGLIDEVATGRDFTTNDGELIAQSGGLALGITFVVTCIALYAYYYSLITYDPTAEARTFSSRKGSVSKEASGSLFDQILGRIDQAFRKWGVPQKDAGCRKRVACESFLPDARKLNAKVSDFISKILNESKGVKWTKKPKSAETQLRELIAAAHEGYNQKSCESYVQNCPDVTLSKLPQQ